MQEGKRRAGTGEVHLLYLEIQKMDAQIRRYEQKVRDLKEKMDAYELIMLTIKEAKNEFMSNMQEKRKT